MVNVTALFAAVFVGATAGAIVLACFTMWADSERRHGWKMFGSETDPWIVDGELHGTIETQTRYRVSTRLERVSAQRDQWLRFAWAKEVGHSPHYLWSMDGEWSCYACGTHLPTPPKRPWWDRILDHLRTVDEAGWGWPPKEKCRVADRP